MINNLKMLLGIKDNRRDELLSFIISDIESMILSYCKIDTLPEQLNSLVPVMAADMYRRKGYGQETSPETVTSISQGQRSVSIKSGTLSTDDFLKEYRQRLNPFRRGRVPSDVR